MLKDYERELKQLKQAIRDAASLEELTRLVGPSEEESAKAVERTEKLDRLSYRIFVDCDATWQDSVLYDQLNAEQNEFESRYA